MNLPIMCDSYIKIGEIRDYIVERFDVKVIPASMYDFIPNCRFIYCLPEKEMNYHNKYDSAKIADHAFEVRILK